MKVGVLGSGDVAKVLAAGFLKHGHSVMIGTRERSKLEKWASENPPARAGSFSEAAAFAEVVVLAVKGTAASSALHLASAPNLAGKPSSTRQIRSRICHPSTASCSFSRDWTSR